MMSGVGIHKADRSTTHTASADKVTARHALYALTESQRWERRRRHLERVREAAGVHTDLGDSGGR